MFKISTFRDHICSIISTFLFDCCLQIGMRPRCCRVGFPSPAIAQITLSSVKISLSLSLTKWVILIIESPNALYDSKSCLYFITVNFRSFFLVFEAIYVYCCHFQFLWPNLHFTLKIDSDVRDSFSVPDCTVQSTVFSVSWPKLGTVSYPCRNYPTQYEYGDWTDVIQVCTWQTVRCALQVAHCIVGQDSISGSADTMWQNYGTRLEQAPLAKQQYTVLSTELEFSGIWQGSVNVWQIGRIWRERMYWIIFKDPVRTAQETQTISVIKTSLLMYREICCLIYKEIREDLWVIFPSIHSRALSGSSDSKSAGAGTSRFGAMGGTSADWGMIKIRSDFG